MTPALIASVPLAILTLTGAALDITARRLPNWLSLATAVGGLAVSAWLHGPSGAGSALLHGLIALVVGMILFRIGAVGGGDAKFYAGLATWFGLGFAVRFLLGVSLAGLGLFVAWFIARRLMGRKVLRRATDDSEKFPYGIAIAAGALLTWFLQPGLL